MSSAKNGRKHPYSYEITHSKNTVRRLKTELNQITKKMNRLLKRREDGKKCANQQCNQQGQDKKGQPTLKRVGFKNTRLQGIAPDSERHNKLKGHIQRLKNQLKELGN